MGWLCQLCVIGVALFCCVTIVKCDEDDVEVRKDFDDLTTQLEEGRTFVHHAMKRLAVLLPVFMFKLGVMFTMMLVTTVTSIKGFLVGTLLLALGIGHFIANRFSSSPTAHINLPHYPTAYHAAPHFIDRSDTVPSSTGYAQQQAYGAWKTQ